MLGRAVQDHHPGLPGLKGTTLSQHYKANANPLKPVPFSALNATIPSWSQSGNPLKRTSSQANGNESSYGSQEQVGKKRTVIDMTQPSADGGRVGKLHDTVFFDENDFDDDADINLDEEISPSVEKEPIALQSSRPMAPVTGRISTASSGTLLGDSQYSRASSRTLLPDDKEKSTAPYTPASSTPLPWSSSPLSHHQMAPLSRTQSKEPAVANITKRRTLPWLDEAAKQKEEEMAREGRRLEKVDQMFEDLAGGFSTQDKARIERTREGKRVREVYRMCEDLAGGDPPAIARQRMREAGEVPSEQNVNRKGKDFSGECIPDFVQKKIEKVQGEMAAREAARKPTKKSKPIPDFVQEKMQQVKEGKAEREALGGAYTPLPKDKGGSKYPWNTTASAIKEQQKQLRQGYRKLVKDNDGDEAAKSSSRKKKQSVAKVFLSEEQRSVLDLVSERKKSVFFTGSAGTGKSVLLREIIKVLRQKYKREPDRVAVTASTGLAACNVGGVTLHSFAGIGLGKEAVPELVKKIKRNQKAKNRWMRTKVLIVDEISMVDGDLFDKLESIARAIRNNGRPFGGIQLIITGDFFQLPPVPDWGKISKFSFDAATWNTSIEHTIGLTQVFRQKDPVFANMLNEMRLGRLTPKSINAFQALARPLSVENDFEATELFPTRGEVDGANSARMRNLAGTEVEFRAEDGGSILDHDQRSKLLASCMAPLSISLKKGAQVMLIKNIDETLVNGSVGKVVAFMDEKTFDIYHEDEDEFQAVETMDLNNEEMTKSRLKLKQMINKDLIGSTSQKWPLVRFAIADGSSRDLLCQRESWKIELPNGEVQASRSQIPLILAWALSIHKAQGQTLERVKVDLGKIFEKGQAYVALSRATSQEGLRITRFDPKKVMAHDRVRTFYDSLYSANQAATNSKEPQKAKAAKDYEEDSIDSAFNFKEDDDAMQAMYGQ